MDATRDPAWADSLAAQAEAHLRAGRIAEARSLCTQILAQFPQHALALHYLGIIEFLSGRREEAIGLLLRATELQPTVAMFFYTLAQALSQTGRPQQAFMTARRAVELKGDDVDCRYMLGTLAGELGHLDVAMENLQTAIELKPDLAPAHNNLGQVYCLTRRIDRAMECFTRAAALDPASHTTAANVVYHGHFDPARDGMRILAEAQAWARKWAEPLTAVAPPPPRPGIDRSPDSPLRIGYVSPDLYEHPVGRFLSSILAHHDRGSVKVFCYADVFTLDAMTARLQSLCHGGWRETAQLSDEALAGQIRADRIDILIDLSLHMAHNRLLAFAREPAPVQVTYLGYAGTSGMSAMDWRLSDPYLDPPENDRFYTERTFRLPRSYWCYEAPAVELSPVPRTGGAIVFGCLNHPMKMSDPSLRAWAQLLSRVPDSRLLIHAQPGRYLIDSIAIFESAGVDPARLEFVGKLPLADYFRLYQRVDIALDPFPYAGGTTTCDALWMGVPVVTLAGEIAVHRGGVSLLSNLGLTDLIAQNVEQYIALAAGLASSGERLAELRATLRRRMELSIVMNASEFTHDFESALRQIWRDHVLSAS